MTALTSIKFITSKREAVVDCLPCFDTGSFPIAAGNFLK